MQQAAVNNQTQQQARLASWRNTQKKKHQQERMNSIKTLWRVTPPLCQQQTPCRQTQMLVAPRSSCTTLLALSPAPQQHSQQHTTCVSDCNSKQCQQAVVCRAAAALSGTRISSGAAAPGGSSSAVSHPVSSSSRGGLTAQLLRGTGRLLGGVLRFCWGHWLVVVGGGWWAFCSDFRLGRRLCDYLRCGE